MLGKEALTPGYNLPLLRSYGGQLASRLRLSSGISACRAESDVRSEEFRENETTVRDKTLPRSNYQFHPQ